MIAPDGRVIYVGKAKRVRTRLLTYFRAPYPEDKAARILHAAGNIEWDYVASEFAALLKELSLIKLHRPVFNVRMNRTRRPVLIKITEGSAPKIFVGSGAGNVATRHYGPFTSRSRVAEGIKAINDLLQLRDCALTVPITFAEQGDLFTSTVHARCLRHELGTCTGPCAGLVTEEEYRRRVRVATDFIEGRGIAPLDRVVSEMVKAGEQQDYERATWWRRRFDALEWLLRATGQARAAVEALSFVYLDPGSYGDDRVYLIRQATVRAVAPAPTTPLEREAFRCEVERHMTPEPQTGPLPLANLDEMMLLISWFNARTAAIRRTVPIADWLADDGRSAISYSL
jgi:excinuclease ABC subunit C